MPQLIQLQRLQRVKPYLWLFWLPLSLLWMELTLKVYAFGTLFDRGLLYTTLFTAAVGLVLDFLCALFRPKTCRRLAIVLLFLFTFIYMAQTVYYTVTTTFFTLFSVANGAGPITQYWRETLLGILEALPVLCLEGIPFILLIWRGKRCFPRTEPGKRLCRMVAGGTVVAQVLGLLAVDVSVFGLMPPRYLYHDSFIPELAVSNFGVLTTLRLDAQQLIFGEDEQVLAQPDEGLSILPTPTPEPTLEPTPTPEPRRYNVLDINFQALAEEEEDPILKAMHEYFGSREPTAKNEYTGLFAGKNLVFLTAEGFSPYAVDEQLTPTLYKLANSGFVFENFYTPLWWVSTSDGEYVNTQSLIPKAGVWSMYTSGSNELPLTLGNQFSRLGYTTRAYHNHYFDYYGRDVSHPNLGYTYTGRGNGLDMEDTWPESDLEMMEETVADYLNDAPFHVYYMTVSGHLNYTFESNDMAARHWSAVAGVHASEEVKAYLACNTELDLALEYLLEQLEQAGQLENTVICLAADHYPYGLDKEFIDEMAGHEVEEDFELYRSTLILWSGDMEEPVVVEKPASNLDILPTLSNLFGLAYDSRLMMGRDILSDSEGLVVFSNHSFITEYGRFNARTDLFTPDEGVTVEEGYAQEMMEAVNDMFTYSAAVLDNDYYSTLGLFPEDALSPER